jgi:hypothetical protein
MVPSSRIKQSNIIFDDEIAVVPKHPKRRDLYTSTVA